MDTKSPSTSSASSSPTASSNATSLITQEMPANRNKKAKSSTRNTRKRRSPSTSPSSPGAALSSTRNTRLSTRPAKEKSASHPSFAAMINDALGHSNDPKGPTRSSLKRFIMNKYKPDSSSLDMQFDRAVKGGVRDGTFEYTNKNNTRLGLKTVADQSKVMVVIAEFGGGQSSSAQPAPCIPASNTRGKSAERDLVVVSVENAHPGVGSSRDKGKGTQPRTDDAGKLDEPSGADRKNELPAEKVVPETRLALEQSQATRVRELTEGAAEDVFDAGKKEKRERPEEEDKDGKMAKDAASTQARRPRKQFLRPSGIPIPDNELPLKKRRYDHHGF